MTLTFNEQGHLCNPPAIMAKQADIFGEGTLEPIGKAFIRICNHMMKFKSKGKPGERIAFYFARGKVSGSQSSTSTHELRLKTFEAGIIGVFLPDTPTSVIYEELEYFYKHK